MKIIPVWLALSLAGVVCASGNTNEQVILHSDEGQGRPLNVAIIGAGAAGSSSAYHLSKFAADDLQLNITIFDQNPYIGGRSTTVDVYDDPSNPVELGASVFVELNKILMNATRDFNLSTDMLTANTRNVPGASLSVWDGQNLVLQQTSTSDWWESLKLLWKYGTAPIKTLNLMKSTVSKFLKMYEEPTFPWMSLTQVAQDVGLAAVTAATGEQYMHENGITGNFGHDIVQASTRVNYAQNLRYIHGLEAMVCMAAQGAMAVEGGNWQIFDQMVTAASATRVLRTEVTSMKPNGDGWLLGYRSSGEDAKLDLHMQHFDSVILAAPYQYTNLSIAAELGHQPDKVPYVQLHVTLFKSPHLLSPAFFNLPSDRPAPKVILTTLPLDEDPKEGPAGCGSVGFFSISLLRPTTNPQTGKPEYLYKIFSPAPPNSTFLSRLLGTERPIKDGDVSSSSGDVTWLYRKVWNSYPYEYPRVTFENIQLADGLWYTGGMDSFISTMETNALMGMNVARLLVDHWQNRRLADVTGVTK